MAKRFLDLSIAIFGISIFLIPMFIISICIILDTRGPIIHWSLRIGLNNQKFLMPKFRSMLKNTLN